MNYKERLGRSTWKFLHTLAEGIPDVLSKKSRFNLDVLIKTISELYPCESCQDHFKKILQKFSVNTSSGKNFRRSICQLHNVVNKSLNKREYPCKF